MTLYLSVRGIRDHRRVRLFRVLQPVLFVQETLGFQDDLAVQGNPSVLGNRSHLWKDKDIQNVVVSVRRKRT